MLAPPGFHSRVAQFSFFRWGSMWVPDGFHWVPYGSMWDPLGLHFWVPCGSTLFFYKGSGRISMISIGFHWVLEWVPEWTPCGLHLDFIRFHMGSIWVPLGLHFGAPGGHVAKYRTSGVG